VLLVWQDDHERDLPAARVGRLPEGQSLRYRMMLLTLPEAIEFALVGAELECAFRELIALPYWSQKKGEPCYDLWRSLALRYNELSKTAYYAEKL
jgi:hypothetical protein